jgi:hypothetical protein
VRDVSTLEADVPRQQTTVLTLKVFDRSHLGDYGGLHRGKRLKTICVAPLLSVMIALFGCFPGILLGASTVGATPEPTRQGHL